ncbi:hypothetical protein UA08_05951 [Talaromyces atroroseus]|uniref:Uncharacterized protein n=1 Tax=Talaromyces atroroseus TaxID=1441469 RepID=A0A225AU55_TALAT|nr:hypothetical protein UA08_05951 [Talaromyces atroroseus]OKL59129.1 hypothetical protein UA08_05951 [Talaromyces atroroseus]
MRSHTFAMLIGMSVIIWTNGLPLIPSSISARQDITTPLGIDAKDLDLGDISPIEDGWLELDSDDGDGNHLGSSSVSNANGYLGSVGSGQASQNGNSLEGSSAACTNPLTFRSDWLCDFGGSKQWQQNKYQFDQYWRINPWPSHREEIFVVF